MPARRGAAPSVLHRARTTVRGLRQGRGGNARERARGLERLFERAQENGVTGGSVCSTTPSCGPSSRMRRGSRQSTRRRPRSLNSPQSRRRLRPRSPSGEVMLRLAAPVRQVRPGRDIVEVEVAGGTTEVFDRLLVCAGLHADRLARTTGEPAEPRVIPFRGE